jgi:hypothetical protein
MAVPVFHVLYVSTASDLFTDAELAQVLEESRTRNAARGITGLLMHFSGNFMQALEWDESVVTSLLERIRMDARHRDFKVLLSYHSAEPEFPDWSMGLEVVAASLDRHTAVLDLARTDIQTHQGASMRQIISRLVDVYRR